LASSPVAQGRVVEVIRAIAVSELRFRLVVFPRVFLRRFQLSLLSRGAQPSRVNPLVATDLYARLFWTPGSIHDLIAVRLGPYLFAGKAHLCRWPTSPSVNARARICPRA
jgi:hypothetical protein